MFSLNVVVVSEEHKKNLFFFNFVLFSFSSQNAAKLQKFCVPAVHGFVRSIALSVENSLQDTLR